MNLVIVESPTKAKTISKFLDSSFQVVACFGHTRDLPQKELGIDVKENFKPSYVIMPKAKKVLREIKDKAKNSENLYLATDYDREGEAIAWHLLQAENFKKQKIHRITFHEITKVAISDALKHPREIDLHLVDAQQARRILDRLVGYKLSPFLWRKVAQGLSAGRVQSVAVRLIVEKEREIEKFSAQEYWSIEALLSKNNYQFKAILTEKDGKKIAKLEIKSEKASQEIFKNLKEAGYKVSDIKKEQKKRYPSPPFTTSTLQQEAANKLGYSAKQTMKLAQDLYEQGLITYMRTDSVHVAPQALQAAAKVITKEFGSHYALSSPRFYKTKSKGAQEAHEAIRPTDLSVIPEKANLTGTHSRLYSLVWKKMLASQMKEAEVLEENVKIKAKNFTFLATGLKITFDGFLKVYQNSGKETILPDLKIGDELNLEKLEKLQHFTEPPARFTEASLIKELEKRGIGRPSTYAPTLGTITDRGYVEKKEGKLVPQEIGTIVNDVLVKHFPEIVDFDFTAKMEEELDEIAEGKLGWQKVISKFYGPFSENLKTKSKEVSKQEITEEESDEVCPKCGKKLKIKLGRFGKFLACTGFPECKFTKPLDDKKGDQKPVEASGEKCPKCQKDLVLKEGKFGKFLACSGYPQCKFTKNIEVTATVPCPVCGGKLLQKRTRKGRTFWGCGNYPKCKTAFWNEPLNEKCPQCQAILLKGKNMVKCSQCDYKK
ncbi:MAG: type I DNA topoisomerase [Patescibacteria group bacterium]|nr:type I DNA topoisomerase [Patescibacteria group bacterium]